MPPTSASGNTPNLLIRQAVQSRLPGPPPPMPQTSNHERPAGESPRLRTGAQPRTRRSLPLTTAEDSTVLPAGGNPAMPCSPKLAVAAVRSTSRNLGIVANPRFLKKSLDKLSKAYQIIAGGYFNLVLTHSTKLDAPSGLCPAQCPRQPNLVRWARV